jgi:hypothetical protein
MKKLFPLMVLTFCFFATQAQNDTIQLKNGTLFTSILRVKNEPALLKITDFRGTVHPVEKGYVERVVLGDSIRSINGWTSYVSKYANAMAIEEAETVKLIKADPAKPIDLHKELADMRDSRHYLKTAGKWGIAGTVLSVVGLITTAVSIKRGNEAVLYTGIAMTGSGLVLYIPAFASLMKAGKREK